MDRKTIFLNLCVLGTILPLAVMVPWIANNGFNIPLLVRQIISSPVASFGWLDVVISGITLVVYIYDNGPKRKVPNWKLAIVATILVGVSLGLPLYLYLREVSIKREQFI